MSQDLKGGVINRGMSRLITPPPPPFSKSQDLEKGGGI